MSFIAPKLKELKKAQLIFEFAVTDNKGETSTRPISVTVVK
ncbi:hypothetical protein FHS09_000487 [Microbulbifer rhizosphaerae]|uniref:Uncharacterized protein n=1 Tax=Microbulbifer rhizosphaerae TaxID=1562603 RepID=A0A7W4W903_9GAMM|nr:hypothetical protein [Microbulbifer rhizosphaerae]